MTRVAPQVAAWGLSFLAYKIGQVVPGDLQKKGTGSAVETAASVEIG
jgi:hypothetical protein